MAEVEILGEEKRESIRQEPTWLEVAPRIPAGI